jgi:hypothetical protein
VDYSDKAEVSSWSMPSSEYIDLTLGASGSTYTAPANGWVMLYKNASASGQYIWMQTVHGDITIYDLASYSSTSGGVLRITIPVKKGDNCVVAYTAGGTTGRFRFIYAEGEV